MIEILVSMVTAGIDNSKPTAPASNDHLQMDFENMTEEWGEVSDIDKL